MFGRENLRPWGTIWAEFHSRPLVAGDRLRLEIGGIGTLENTIRRRV